MKRSEELFEVGSPVVLEEPLLDGGIVNSRALPLVLDSKYSGRIHGEVSQTTTPMKDQAPLCYTGVNPICCYINASPIARVIILSADSK